VPYPKFLCQLYFGYFFESLIINKSRETLAIIEAAAIEVIFSSPLIIVLYFIFIPLGAKAHQCKL